MSRFSRWFALVAFAAAPVAGFAAESEMAAPAPVPAPVNTGAINFNFGADFQTADFFRGVRQTDNSPIIKANIALQSRLIESENFNLKPYIGLINTFAERSTANPPLSFYECDILMGLDWQFNALTVRTAYNARPSPNGSFATIHEAEASFWYDDGGLWDKLGLPVPIKIAPHAGYYREIRDNNFVPFVRSNPHHLDTYVEVGITPQTTISPFGAKWPITISVPATLGLSPDDYYDLGNTGHNDTLGYVSVSGVGSIPLPVPQRFGAWEFHASFNWMHDYARDAITANNGRENLVWFATGVGIRY